MANPAETPSNSTSANNVVQVPSTQCISGKRVYVSWSTEEVEDLNKLARDPEYRLPNNQMNGAKIRQEMIRLGHPTRRNKSHVKYI